MAKPNIDPFAVFLTSRANTPKASASKAPVAVSEWEGRKILTFSPPDSKPFNLGPVKIALVLTLTDAAVQALKALPPGLLDVTGPRAEFIRAHRAEIAALWSQIAS